MKRIVKKPKLRASDRVFWVTIQRLWAGWREVLVSSSSPRPSSPLRLASLAQGEMASSRLPPVLVFELPAVETDDGAKPLRAAFRCPWQNPVAERFVGTARRDLLDHVVALDERHLLRLLREFVGPYYATDRTHLGLAKDTPAGRPSESRPSPTARVVALPRCGGLHHRYRWCEAA